MRRVDRTHTNDYALTLTGISEMVRDKEFVLLTGLDTYKLLDPKETRLTHDTSSGYQATLLHIESHLRRTPPTDEHIWLGHKAAMDPVSYQLVPALMALEQPRPRILIADAVGLGKTLEAGILLTELIRRGRGKRILVVTMKSMLTQFQKELWSRFTIPLVRLDSVGIQRVRTRIPSNHNPFYYYDRSIISIDTLKMARDYRAYIEDAYWDVIVIDEAQNVAERGTRSLRSRLATLLASRSDALIMLSATPHDGRARSFASLIRMLDPTVIADPTRYSKADLADKNLFIRRFKKDIKHQVEATFPEREITLCHMVATPEEEAAFDVLTQIPGALLSSRRGSAPLLRTVLEKALFSSPTACLETLTRRLERLKKMSGATLQDLQALHAIRDAVACITPDAFSKYQLLLQTLQSIQWTGKNAEDRLVIFTERIDTLRFLAEHLQKDLKLKKGAIATLDGSMSDVDQQTVVDDFGRLQSGTRMLIASDVGSEGINLHFQCHRLIHFDIPWSLMVFQQRNGRIDRYGQTRTPCIYYLLTACKNQKIRGDIRILEFLIEKEKQAVQNIGDPAAIIGAYDVEQEERVVIDIIEHGMGTGEAEYYLQTARRQDDDAAFDFADFLTGRVPTQDQASTRTRRLPSLYSSDYAFLTSALRFLHAKGEPVEADYDDEEKRLELTALPDLKYRFDILPREARPRNDRFVLSGSSKVVMQEMARCRAEELAWPQIQYLWPLHPVVEWASDKVATNFRRQEAPVVVMRQGMSKDTVIFLLSGVIPNRKAHPMVHAQFAIPFVRGQAQEAEPFDHLQSRLELGTKSLPNTAPPPGIVDRAERLLPKAIDRAIVHMAKARDQFLERNIPKLNKHRGKLKELERRHVAEITRKFRHPDRLTQGRKERETRRVLAVFEEYQTWIKDTMRIERDPYIQVIAVFISSHTTS